MSLQLSPLPCLDEELDGQDRIEVTNLKQKNYIKDIGGGIEGIDNAIEKKNEEDGNEEDEAIILSNKRKRS